MLFSELSPSGDPLQLPKLELGKLSSDYFPVISDFYETDLDETVYKVTQVYLGADGKLKLDLVPKELNVFNDILSFTGKNVVGETQPKTQNNFIENPMQIVADYFLDQSPVWVVTPRELEFLAQVPLETPRDINFVNDPLPLKLAALLSSGRSQIKWGVGSLNPYSAAGFSVEYYGKVEDAPSGYSYPELADTVAIVKLNCGTNKGRVMLCSKALT